VLHGGGVDGDLVRAGLQQVAEILQRLDAPADAVGDEHLFRGARGDIDNRAPPLVRSGDVQEHQLVRSLAVVKRRQLHRVPGVAEIEKIRPFHHPPVFHVQAGDHTFCEHGSSVKGLRFRVKLNHFMLVLISF